MMAVAKEVGEQVVEVWPENHRAFLLFRRVETQWNVGAAGASGLRYEAVYPLLDREAKDSDDWDELFEGIQAIEGGALTAMSEGRD